MTWRVLSRASRLARLQVDEALGVLGSDDNFERQVVQSFGDRHLELSLLDPATPADLFTRELDEALRRGEADFAVHSAKDLTPPLAPDIELVALLPAAEQTDALVVRDGLPRRLEDLPPGCVVGTSSPTRRAEVLRLRPDLAVAGIRGTIEDRLAQLDDGRFDAVIVATCALRRLGLDQRLTQVLPFATHPLQGHLAVTALRGRPGVAALWQPVDLRRRWGRVSLVGAGPGDPELATVKALRRLREADVVFHDSLANTQLLEGLSAEIVFVGKRGDSGGELQQTLNERLWRAAVSGQTVVRLKGGDPMIFGRATEETDYLEQRLVDVEVVPGVSAAQAASAYAQIALTERQVSSSVAFCLGAPADRIATPDAETLVYYMASATLAVIVDKLLAAGRPGPTPVALVRQASLPDQQTWYHTLASLRDELVRQPDHPYASPLLLFVGPVVRPERASSWFSVLPRLWYTGTSTEHFHRPVRLVHRPLIALEPLQDASALDAELGRLGSFDWVLFTSRATVDAVTARLGVLGLDARAWSGRRLGAVGRATAEALLRHGLSADLVADTESSRGLVEALVGAGHAQPGTTVLLPASDRALAVLAEGLRAHGVVVTTVAAYRNVDVAPPPVVDLADIDEVVLTSPSTARAFARLHPQPPARVLLTPMGEQTHRALEELFPGRTLGPAVLAPGGA